MMQYLTQVYMYEYVQNSNEIAYHANSSTVSMFINFLVLWADNTL